MPKTNVTDTILAGQNYAYDDIFENIAETELDVEALESGGHSLDVIYVLDNSDLCTKTLVVPYQVGAVELDIRETAQPENRVGYNDPQHNPSNARNKVLIWGNGNKTISFDLKKPLMLKTLFMLDLNTMPMGKLTNIMIILFLTAKVAHSVAKTIMMTKILKYFMVTI